MTEKSDPYSLGNTLPPFLSLFFSAGTLLCCALPALMVSLGMGAVLAGWVSAIPQLVWLSHYKIWLFGFAAAMLALSGYMQWQARSLPCPADQAKARACLALRKTGWAVWGFSVTLFVTGIFFAYIAPLFI